MSYEPNEQPDVQQFLHQWHFTEKSAERMAGILLIFAAAAVVALETAGDEFTVLAAAFMVAAGLTLLLRSRRPAQERNGLRFTDVDQQRSRAYLAAAGALTALSMGAFSARPLLLIGSFLLGILAGWYFWRARKVQQYDSLLQASTTTDETEP